MLRVSMITHGNCTSLHKFRIEEHARSCMYSNARTCLEVVAVLCRLVVVRAGCQGLLAMPAHNLLALVLRKVRQAVTQMREIGGGEKKSVRSADDTFMQEALWCLEILSLTCGCDSCWQPGPMEKEEVGLKGEHRDARTHADENMESVGIDPKEDVKPVLSEHLST